MDFCQPEPPLKPPHRRQPSRRQGRQLIAEGDFRLQERLSPAKTARVEFTEKNAPVLPAANSTANIQTRPVKRMTLEKVITANGKIQSRKRTGANAMEQRMIAQAIKRARYMALLPYVSAAS